MHVAKVLIFSDLFAVPAIPMPYNRSTLSQGRYEADMEGVSERELLVSR